MPSSGYSAIPIAIDLVRNFQPRSILDIGIGYGKYGVLFREYLDVWKTDRPIYERSFKLIGVEAYEPYRNPIWDVYDEVHIGDVLELNDTLKQYYPVDLLFMGDVIEHFTKEEGDSLLKSIHCSHVIIITPIRVSSQTAVYGNKYETHKSYWGPEDLPGYFHFTDIQNQRIYWF